MFYSIYGLGPANGEVMAEILMQYKEPGVKELTDSTFEHLTQVINNHHSVSLSAQGSYRYYWEAVRFSTDPDPPYLHKKKYKFGFKIFS